MRNVIIWMIYLFLFCRCQLMYIFFFSSSSVLTLAVHPPRACVHACVRSCACACVRTLTPTHQIGRDWRHRVFNCIYSLSSAFFSSCCCVPWHCPSPQSWILGRSCPSAVPRGSPLSVTLQSRNNQTGVLPGRFLKWAEPGLHWSSSLVDSAWLVTLTSDAGIARECQEISPDWVFVTSPWHVYRVCIPV